MKKILLAIVVLCWAASARANVVFDANATADCQQAAVVGTAGKTCATLTVGAGANRAVLCAVAFSLHSPTTEVGTWDSGGTNQAMTQIIAVNTSSTTGRSELWGLVAPTSGLKTVKFTWVGTSDIYINCTSFTGVNQTGGATSFPNSKSQTGGFGTGITMAITSATGNFTYSLITEDLGTISALGNTTAFIESTDSISAGGQYATGAASVTHTATVGTSGAVYTWVGTDIAAAGAGGCTAKPSLALLGVGNCAG